MRTCEIKRSKEESRDWDAIKGVKSISLESLGQRKTGIWHQINSELLDNKSKEGMHCII